MGADTLDTEAAVNLDSLMEKAWAMQSRRDYAGARAVYQKVVDTDPGHAEAHHQLGLVALRQGLVKEAIGHLEGAIRLAPENPDFRTSLGETLAQAGDFPAAIEHLEAAHRTDPEDPDILSALGEAYYRFDRSTKAVSIFERLLELQPGSTAVGGRLGVAIVALRRGHPARDLNKAIDLLRAGLRANPNAIDLRISLARALGDLSLVDEARTHFDVLQKRFPNDIAVWANLAEFYILQADRDTADRYYQRALKLAAGNPDFEARVLDRAADGFLAKGQAKNAVNYLKRARSLSNRDTYFAIKLGAAYLHAGWKEAAAEAILPLIKAGQGDDDAYLIYATGLIRARRHQEALDYLMKIKDQAALRWRPNFQIVECYQKLNRYEEARKCIEELLANEQTFIEAYGALSKDPDFTLDEAGRDRLRRCGANSSLPFETRANAWFTLGREMRRKGKYRQAFRFFAKGNEVKRTNIEYDTKYMDAMAESSSWAVSPEVFAELTKFGAETDAPVFILGMPRSGKSTLEEILSQHPGVYCLDEADYLPRIKREFQMFKERMGANAPDNLALTGPRVIKGFADRLAERYVSVAEGKIRVTDTGPGNDLNLGFIALLLPRARMIFCQRHPLDVGIECYFKNFHSKLAYGFELGEIGHFYQTCMKQREYWSPYLANPVTVIQFEKLMADPETEVRRILEFCGLDWHPDCLDFWLERKKIYTDSVGIHRHFEEHLGPLIAGLGGYEKSEHSNLIDEVGKNNGGHN